MSAYRDRESLLQGNSGASLVQTKRRIRIYPEAGLTITRYEVTPRGPTPSASASLVDSGQRRSESSRAHNRLREGVGPPPPHAGPPMKWGYLRLETIDMGDFIELTLDPGEAKQRVNAVRSYAGRFSRKTGKKFSVRITDYGIGIWRTQ